MTVHKQLAYLSPLFLTGKLNELKSNYITRYGYGNFD